MCTLCDSTYINTIISGVFNNLSYTVHLRLSCLCLWNHKGCIYTATISYVTKTWSVVLLNKKNTYTPISSVLCMTSC